MIMKTAPAIIFFIVIATVQLLADPLCKSNWATNHYRRDSNLVTMGEDMSIWDPPEQDDVWGVSFS